MQSRLDVIVADLLALNTFIATHSDFGEIIEKVMQVAAKTAVADGYFFYEITPDKYMTLVYSDVKSLSKRLNGMDNALFYETKSLSEIRQKSSKRPAELCALGHEIINAENIYHNSTIDTTFISGFDKKYNYTTVSTLVIPLVDRKHNVIGVAQFINALDHNGRVIGFSQEIQNAVVSICRLLTLTLERKGLREAYSSLLESVIEVLARAIDAKSPYTNSHCQKVPIIARLLATAAVEEDEGPLKDFEMDDDEWYSLHIASWLHDCGKVTTPDYIADKASKLETINNRIHEIRNRFEILRRDAHINYLQKRLNNMDTKQNLQLEYAKNVKKLEDDFAFVANCNVGDIELNDADLQRLDNISRKTFTRYFNRMLGLSWTERNAVQKVEEYTRPGPEPLLQDRPDHVGEEFNRGELYNLKIRKGTINQEERNKINDHVRVTIEMLKALYFTQDLKNVVEYAGCHHERIDGNGYPNQLKGDEMSVPAKIMAIADIFEALTANDHSYKEPKKLSKVLRIMQNMKNTGHIDPDLYQVFLNRGVYREYAESYMDPNQVDEIVVENYL